ncbi:nucleoside 2-deoxyribosyltransferase [Cellulosilyticum ruminicola]|uniref:nucleoside 2-deoxyribosyltransferase n=1 Tax=Cellulosilyticum ruminicola TaxID=425254 RepID=UPI0006D00761|nr:nucleoside 2-deoxyribosyltransferase [Cellulosilyticum ruminicola]
MCKIFLACPISKYLNGEDFTNYRFKQFIISIYELCKKYSDDVFFALDREKFGKERMQDDVCTPLDFVGMKDTDLVIAIPEDSMGVAVELGWASALGKEIILILDQEYKYSPLVKALGTVTPCEIIELPEEDKYNLAQNEILTILGQKIADRVADVKQA